jgi:hypothetical protein
MTTQETKTSRQQQKRAKKDELKKAEQKRLTRATETRQQKQQDIATKAISNNPLDRPTTEAEWISTQDVDSRMMRRLRSEISEGSGRKISFNKRGLMI